MANGQRYDYVLPKGFVLKGGINDYVVEEVLGKGGFGITYKVKTTVLYMNINIKAYFAVKEFFPDICSRESDNTTIKIPETKWQEVVDGKKDFINEGLKLQEVCKLNPSIVNVNEVFEANGTAYYVLEYLDGGDLRKMVHDNGKPLSEQQMLDVMTPIGHALQCLHDNRILHLDVKPDNIVMRRKNDGTIEPVLIDFGIAIHFNSDGSPTSRTPSQGISPGYSPIEQYSQVMRFDPRLDVYAYCATCVYLLSGKDPIEATDMSANFVRDVLPNKITEKIAESLERGMDLNKSARVGSINKMLSLLTDKNVSQNKPKFAKKDSDSETMWIHDSNITPPTPEPSKSRMNMLIILSSVLVVALIVGILWFVKRSSLQNREKIINDYVDNMVYVDGNSFTIEAFDDDSWVYDKKKSDKIDDLYDALKADGVVQKSKENFRNFVLASGDEGVANRKALYEALKADGAITSPTQEEFERRLGIITLSSFYIGQTEVTQELWEAIMGSNPSGFKGAKRPVENVSWDDCQEFISKINAKTGKNFRLPTEVEWVYAARGGNRSQHYKYSGSNMLSDVAWYMDNSGSYTHDVATKRANELGIYDMSGNVLEWCSDWYGDYTNSLQNNTKGISLSKGCVNRGGAWSSGTSRCRVSNRDINAPYVRDRSIGLRLAL